MTPNEGTAVNLGKAIGGGLILNAVEVVAVLHNACLQLEAGSAAALTSSIDDLWITGTGKVVLPRITRVEPARATVGRLLETLLPPANAANYAVPAALRTLPTRLRESASTSDTSDVKDLLTILGRHLPDDSSEVLRKFVARAQLATVAPQPVAAIGIADRGDGRPPAAIATVATAPVRLAAAVVAPGTHAQAVVPPAAIVTPPTAPAAPRSSGTSRRSLALAAVVVLAVGAAGFAGYQFSTRDTDMSMEALLDAPAPVVPREGRITPAAVTSPSPLAPPPAGSNARPLELAVNGGAFSPSFDAKGTALIFHAGQNNSGRLFQASLDDRGTTSAVTPLLGENGRAYHARLSPDGIWVAFDSDRDGERGVYVASRNGLHVARVSGNGFAAVPSWSPDMKWLAFVRAEPGRPKVWNLWLRDVESGELRRQSAFRAGQVWGASWFPGSGSIAYSHEDQLIVSDIASGTVKRFKSPLAGRLVRTPAVSPDGNRIVFQVYRDGAWLLDVKSGVMSRLLDDPSAEEFAWDPDGRQLAYHSRRDGQWRIWLLTI